MAARTDLPTVDLFGVKVAALTLAQTVDHADRVIREGGHVHHTVINAAKVVQMQSDRALFESVADADLINADGQAIVWAARFLGRPLPERVTGIDLMFALIELAARRRYKVYFFGARQQVVEQVVAHFTATYGPQLVAGYRNGYYTPDEEAKIAADIAASGASLLLVAMSSPMKEQFLHRHREVLSTVNFVMGVGGSFDVVAGVVQRAPLWMQKTGLEWVYRLMQEPKRMWRRYLIGNCRFIALMLRARLRGASP